MKEYYYIDTVVTGYHGCSSDIKNELLNGTLQLLPSENEYDWLGNGIYFWENDALRANEWATYKYGKNAAVVGAKIKLNHCFDMSNS